MSYTLENKSNGEDLVRLYVKTRDHKAKDHAIRAFLPLVKYIAGRINFVENGVMRREDIYQYGIVGLLESLERYQPEIGVSFKSFAYKRIHGEIIDAIRKEGILNRDQMKSVIQLASAEDKLRASLGREPTQFEICDEIGISEDRYFKIQKLSALSSSVSLDENIYLGENHSVLRNEMITDVAQEPPDLILEKESLKEELKRIIQELPERQRLILALYFYEDLILFDIGQVLGISESRVSQILKKTLSEIKKKLS